MLKIILNIANPSLINFFTFKFAFQSAPSIVNTASIANYIGKHRPNIGPISESPLSVMSSDYGYRFTGWRRRRLCSGCCSVQTQIGLRESRKGEKRKKKSWMFPPRALNRAIGLWMAGRQSMNLSRTGLTHILHTHIVKLDFQTEKEASC